MPLSRPKLLPEEAPVPQVTDGRTPDSNFMYHPGYGLTARGIVAAFRQAELGYPVWQCDMFDDVIESDAHLRSQLSSRIAAVAGKPWLIQAGGASPDDRKAAEFLDEALRNVPNFVEALTHQLKANWYGYSATEIQWDLDENGRVVPVWFANVPHRRIIFTPRNEPLLLSIDAPSGEQLEVGGWWTLYPGDHPIPPRAGLMRTATWWAFFKRMAVRDWVVFAERFGLPYVTGEYGPEASEDDKRILGQAIASLGKDGQAKFSSACKIVVHAVREGGKSTDVHGAITNLCNAEISKLITGATLTAETSGPGSFALGKVHADQAFDLRAADAEKLAQRFEADIGAPFVRYNRMNARAPRLKINVVRDIDPMTRARIAAILANDLGLTLDEEQIRQEFNFRAPNGTPLVGQKKGTIGAGDAGTGGA